MVKQIEITQEVVQKQRENTERSIRFITLVILFGTIVDAAVFFFIIEDPLTSKICMALSLVIGIGAIFYVRKLLEKKLADFEAKMGTTIEVPDEYQA